MRKAIVLLVGIMLLIFTISVLASSGGWQDDRVGSIIFVVCIKPADSEFICFNDSKQYQEVSIRSKINKTEHLHALKTDFGNSIYWG